MSNPADAERYACPTCAAEIGRRCSDQHRRPRRRPCVARQRMANRAHYQATTERETP
jgi:hypothetical protein